MSKVIEQVVLVDGKNFAYRNYYANKNLATRSGVPTGLLHGCLEGMLALAKRLPNTPFVWVWDGEGKTWRHEALPAYKANRQELKEKNAEDQERMHRQLPWLKGILRTAGFRQFEVKGFEGDDLVGLLTTHILYEQLAENVIICSGDRDFYQFIGPNVRQLKGIKDQNLLWASKEEIKQEFGITVKDWTKLRAITGDTSDNIPHLFDRVGPKTVAEWIRKGVDPSQPSYKKGLPPDFHAPIKVRGLMHDIKANWDKVHLNYRLCQIVTSPEEKCLSHEVKADLHELLSRCCEEKYLRRKVGDPEQTWRALTALLARYELYDVMSHREQLLKLP